MMRRLLLFCFFAFVAVAMSAQNNLVIRDFKYQQYDQTANLKGTLKKDNNAHILVIYEDARTGYGSLDGNIHTPSKVL